METQQEPVGEHTASENQSVPTPGYRIEGGRRYYDRENIAYVLPDDDEENDRVHLQHWLLKVIFNGNYNSPVEDALVKGIRVLDSGCGPGTWTLDMAKTYPNSTFYGVDISTRFPEAIKPPNCHFKVHNILETNGFPDNHFDFIHQRLLIAGLLKDHWRKVWYLRPDLIMYCANSVNKVITDYVNKLAPGGWLECAEPAFGLSHNIGPKYQVLIDAFNAMCQARGLFADIPNHLEDIFRDAGLINIEHKVAGGPIDNDTQFGKLGWEDFKSAFIGLKPVVSRVMPEIESDERYEAFLDEVREECIERNTHTQAYRIWGQKPLVESE
ncbi:S-adenosyl-L-methionine-dependent methyltransferase [Dichotomocladium elegans]|nr:S-adenosyl-L-methionine-dependent methyltransferase [Dichotomocladium elegans]